LSFAFTVTVLMPSCSGIAALHAVVPLAIPDAPVLVLQETCVTPPPSLAVPVTFAPFVTVYEGELVGDAMTTDGGVVSGTV
jgi:hypothetical protein